MVKQQNRLDIVNETDDVFEESAESRVKIEKVQEEYAGNGEILRIVLGGTDNLSNLNHALSAEFCKVRKRSSLPDTVKRPILDHKLCNVSKEFIHEDVGNSSTETGRSLNNEDPDDIFDEEREKEEIDTEIKLEIDEKNSVSNSEENFNLLTVIKQEIDTDPSVHDDNALQETFDNEAASVEDIEHHNKVEFGAESKKTGIDKNILKRVRSSLKMGNNEETVNKQMENGNSKRNKSSLITNIDSNCQTSYLNVERRHKQPLVEILAKKIEYVTKESRKDEVNIDSMQSSKQNDEKEVNANTVIDTTESGEQFKGAENFNEATDHEQNLDRNNVQGENVERSCRSQKAKQTEMENNPRVNKNNCKSLEEFSKVGVNHDTKNKIRNTEILNHCITSENKKSKIEIRQLLKRNSCTNVNKRFVGKKNQNHRKRSLRNFSASTVTC